MTDFNSELTFLRQQLRQAEISAVEYASLIKKREEIEEYELELQKKFNEENSNRLPMQADPSETEKALKLLKKKKQEIDRLSDAIGENIFEKIEEYHTELLTALFTEYPERQLVYNEKIRNLTLIDHDIQKISSAQDLCQSIHVELSKIESTRHRIRQKGIFSYIFGVNPNIAITQHLKSIESLIKEALPSFHDQKEFSGLETFLNTLHEQSKARWGFRKIDATVKSALVENANMLATLDVLKSHKDTEKQQALASIEKFITSDS